ncbi:MAG TPA: hypothetical protein VFA27_07095 [Vicinamibacterales bacterium]|nr:hypothetical protein [Vicinamibacterales bacterium]
MHFYNVRGLLIRRWVPAGRRTSLEVWTGDGWAPHPDIDDLLRFGMRLTDAEAQELLLDSRRRASLPPMTESDADIALRSRLRWLGAPSSES